MFNWFKKKVQYTVTDVVIDKPCYYRTLKDYHQLLATFQYTIFYTIDGVQHAYTGIVANKTLWDGASIPEVAECYIGEPLDEMFAMESLVHDDLCNIDFIGEVRDKAFRLLLKRSEVVVKELGDKKIGHMYTAVVQYREWKHGVSNKISKWMGC